MKKLSKILIVLLLMITTLNSGIGVNAAGESKVPIDIKNIKLTDDKNEEIGNGTISQYREIRIHIDLIIPNSDNSAKENDYTIIDLPKEIKIESAISFDLLDSKTNQKVATAYVDQVTKQLKIVYTNYIENHSDIELSLFVGTKIDTKVVTENKKVELIIKVDDKTFEGGELDFKFRTDNVQEEFTKYMSFANNEGSEIRYTLRVNTVGFTFNDVTVYDEMRTPGTTYDKSSFKIEKGTYELDHDKIWQFTATEDVTNKYNIQFSDNDRRFSVHFGPLTPTDRFKITYKMKTGHDSVPGEQYKNFAYMKDVDNIVEAIEVTATYSSGGGDAIGYQYKIQLNKVDKDNKNVKLAGAQFEVKRERSGVVVGTITTNSDGVADISGLLRDKYIIKEIKAPEGYILSTDEIIILPEDFDDVTKIAVREISNSQIPITITGTKIWDDKSNQDGVRPDSITVTLLANGVELSNVPTWVKNGDTWTFEFSDLPKYENGNEIKYTVKEEVINDYVLTQNGFVLTNKYDPKHINITGTKTWDDANNIEGFRPDSIVVKLHAGGVELPNTPTWDKTNDVWTYEFTDLPKFANGNEIEYTVTEEAVEGYETKITAFDITNTRKPTYIDITGTKTWIDDNNFEGFRPDTIIVKIYADGVELQNVPTWDKTNDVWTYEFKDLPKFANKKEIVYTVDEVKVEGYEKIVSGFDIFNTRTTTFIDINGMKTWDDDNNIEGFRPDSIIVKLHAGGVELPNTPTWDKTNDVWTYEFKKLPKFANGSEIKYTVTEDKVPGYESNIVGFDITNSRKQVFIDINGTKTWDDENNVEGFRPDSINVKLHAGGVELPNTPTWDKTNDVWTYEFKNLPKFANGSEIKYSVTEETVEGYDTEISGFDITNSRVTSYVDINGTKTWVDDDNLEGFRPDSIIVKLYADGVELQNVPTWDKTKEVWTYEFKNLPKFANKKEIVYTILEVKVPGYETEINGFDITNSRVTSYTDIEGTKTWNDQNNLEGFRPDSITLRLYANGKELSGVQPTWNKSGNVWTYEYIGLSKYEDGEEIIYTIKEDPVDGYTQLIEGFDITNTRLPVFITIKGTKFWDDYSNSAGKRPENIVVRLYADGIEVANVSPVWVKKGDTWTYEFKNLPEFQKGKEISYTVSEDYIKGYKATIKGFEIINTYTPELPSTGLNQSLLGPILMTLGIVLLGVDKRRKSRSHRI